MAPVMIMAGGTGGHIFPGLAVARLLRDQQVPVIWLGARGGLETRLVPAEGFAIETLDIGGLRGKSLSTMLSAPIRLLRATFQAISLLRRHRPRSVLSMGGYAAGPGGLAAWLLRRPLLVHEQNRIPGLTNRSLARLARAVFSAFPDAFASAAGVETVGNPVRADIEAVPPPEQRLAGRKGALRLLVIGGSLGARALNRDLPRALALQPRAAWQIRHQCGERFADEARQAYQDAGVEAQVEPFIADMAAAYGWADLVVCRAGALTVSELAAAGVAAALVPFPYAVDDHQTRNAEYLVEAGAARLIPESAQWVEQMSAALVELSDRECLLRMAQAARSKAQPGAASRVAQRCIEEGLA